MEAERWALEVKDQHKKCKDIWSGGCIIPQGYQMIDISSLPQGTPPSVLVLGSWQPHTCSTSD